MSPDNKHRRDFDLYARPTRFCFMPFPPNQFLIGGNLADLVRIGKAGEMFAGREAF